MRAGYLLGITRIDQPGPFGGEPELRTAMISGGVLSSFPSQNGQNELGGTASRSGVKSIGRPLRSVAMMTHLLERGSCLSSDIRRLSVLGRPRLEARRDSYDPVRFLRPG